MAFPNKKPGVSVSILGIGKKPMADEPPPMFGGSKSQSMDEGSPEEEAAETPEQEKAEGIPPDAVSFRTGEMKCAGCEYMQDSGDCSKLGIPVQPEDSCNLFSASQKGPSEEGEPPMGDMGIGSEDLGQQ